MIINNKIMHCDPSHMPHTHASLAISSLCIAAGDAYGANNELWSLRGLGSGAPGPLKWTQLVLEGDAAPLPRRGHAGACASPPGLSGTWAVFEGGLSEQKSLLGMKKQSEYLSGGCVSRRAAIKVACTLGTSAIQ